MAVMVAAASSCCCAGLAGSWPVTFWYTAANAAQSLSRLPVSAGMVASGWSIPSRSSSWVNPADAAASSTRSSSTGPA
jgi:hypothetical protein